MNGTEQVRAARRSLQQAVVALASQDRREFGVHAAHQSRLLREGLAPLGTWASRGFAEASPLEALPDQFREPAQVLIAHHAASAERRTKRQNPGDAAIQMLGGPGLLVDTADSVTAELPNLDANATDGLAGRLARWVLDTRIGPLTLATTATTTDATLRHVAAVEHPRQAARLGKTQKRAEEWRKVRSVTNRWALLDDGSTQFGVLQGRAFAQYSQIGDRVRFYRWAYDFLATRGHEVRWPLAASIVAEGARTIAYMGSWGGMSVEALSQVTSSVRNTLQAAMRTGNQVIFDDVLPKLADLVERGMLDGPLVDQDAINWDADTLSEEQHLVQPLYDGMSPEDLQDLHDIARNGPAAVFGAWLLDAGEVPAGPYNRAGEVPPFRGSMADLATVTPRWRYGINVAASFSTLMVAGSLGPMPRPRPEYTDGSAYRRLNVRPNLHLLASILDDVRDIEFTEAVQLVRQMSTEEKAELCADELLLKQLQEELDAEEYQNLFKLLQP